MAETVALIVAAGRGARAGDGIPKQFRPLAGKPVLRWVAEAFLRHRRIDAVQAVIHDDDRELYEVATAGLDLNPPVSGGATRSESVRRGLEALCGSAPRRVLIHDGARPLVSGALIERVTEALDTADAAAPLLPVTDTLRRLIGVEHLAVYADHDQRQRQTRCNRSAYESIRLGKSCYRLGRQFPVLHHQRPHRTQLMPTY